jgi:CheY-like chemotaxis protein
MKKTDFKILIAEDEAAARRLYEKAFRQEGYEVTMAETGGQVLAELEEAPYDLLITDLKLGGMSALEALPILRRRNPSLPIIVVSGHYVNLVEEFHDKGFKVDLFVPKPVSLSDLKKAVRHVLGLPLEGILKEDPTHPGEK